MSYNTRPPSNRPGARMAWDYLQKYEAPRLIVKLWYAPEMDDGAWCAQMDDGGYVDVDVLVTNYWRQHGGPLPDP